MLHVFKSEFFGVKAIISLAGLKEKKLSVPAQGVAASCNNFAKRI
jgi:hypothetical protein